MIKNPIDRPFRSREEIESEQALVAQYREIGNAELLATHTPETHPQGTNEASHWVD